ncbi:MAG: homoserine O-acetyltransferase [Arenimonas sp.]|nr:homoserine O-acetyltransferase [Arenimonas sp.]
MTEAISPGTRFVDLPSPFAFKRGGELRGGRMAFETWGELNPARDNAVLILTGLSPSAHAAANPGNPEPGWWEAMLGPGKAIDTGRWFVVCVNSLGSCKGSTGAASTMPGSDQAYRLDYPDLSIEDGARAAHVVVQSLGIDALACVIGNSMGGMTALAYLLLHPGAARSHINVSGSAQALPFSIAIRSLQREAIRLDPQWNGGNYDDASYPENGMRIARKLGVVTYRSAMEWDGRFGRVKLDGEMRGDEDLFGQEFEIERYLEAHAQRFVRSFDPNCYLYLGRSMDLFDVAEYGSGDVMKGLASIRVARALAIGVHTDILFPLQQQQQVADGLRAGGADAEFLPLPSPQGHDAFLVDIARFAPPIAAFLEKK